jgi:photosystem II stability/assembly factor-like uncharacterized protein
VGATVVVLLVAGGWLAARAANQPADPTARPALMTARATSSVLLAISRAGARLVAAGEHGIILLSDDDGVTWRQAHVPASVTLTDLFFATPTRGWAVGHAGTVLHSEDGGTTWTKQPLVTPAPPPALFAVHFLDERRGFVAGAFGALFATADGGVTWSPWDDHLGNAEGKHLYAISGDQQALYVAGERAALFCTHDGGRSFATLSTPYQGTFFGVLAPPGGPVLVYGLRGHVLRSSDGATWLPSGSDSPAAVTAGMWRQNAADPGTLLVNQAGAVLESHDQGRTFVPLPLGPLFPLTDVAQAADGAIVVVGARGVQRLAAIPQQGATRR